MLHGGLSLNSNKAFKTLRKWIVENPVLEIQFRCMVAKMKLSNRSLMKCIALFF